MSVSTDMVAVFRKQLAPAAVKAFAAWVGETFDGSDAYATAQALWREDAKLTALLVHWEAIEPDVNGTFEDYVRGVARTAKCKVAVCFDYEGEPLGDLDDLEAWLADAGEALFDERLSPIEEAWVPLDLRSGKAKVKALSPPPPPRPAATSITRPTLPEPDALLRTLSDAPASVARAQFGDLRFERDDSGRFTRLTVLRSSYRRDLGPALRALRGLVKHVSVESRDDVTEVRDALDLSVCVAGEQNPFFDG